MKRSVVTVAIILILVATSMTAFTQARKTEKARDPVCGILVDKDPHLSAEYRGETYYFCSRADMEKFRKEPEKYVHKR